MFVKKMFGLEILTYEKKFGSEKDVEPKRFILGQRMLKSLP